jgi:FlaA1/EpsC-like NDP-sugar epimerase
VSPERLRDIMQRLAQAGVTTKILSRLVDLADDKARPRNRSANSSSKTCWAPAGAAAARPVRPLRARQDVLVTGAGGSIGSELCRQIVTLAPSRLHLLDHSEFAALHDAPGTAARASPTCPSMPTSARSATPTWSSASCSDEPVDTIYHAAAYKHVPLVEANIVEGLRNNVLGAQVIAAAGRHGTRSRPAC